MRHALTSTMALLVLAAYSCAQGMPQFPLGINVTATPSPGSGHDYIKMLDETVNPANGSLSVRVEAPVPKQRGDVNFPYYVFGYDSGGVTFPSAQVSCNPVAGTGFCQNSVQILWSDSGASPCWNEGWFVANQGLGQVCSTPVSLYTVIRSTPPTLTATCGYETAFTYTDPYGSPHPLGMQWVTTIEGASGDEGCSWYGIPMWITNGGDGHYQAEIYPGPSCTGETCPESPVYVTDAHGRSWGRKDTNGNLPFTPTATFTNNKITAVTIAGISNPYRFTYGTTTRNYTPGATLITSISNSSCPAGLPTDSANNTVIKIVTLPNGQTYRFYYGTDVTPHGAPSNPYGLLSEIDYPTGAWVSYTWSSVASSESLGLGSTSVPCYYRHAWPYIQKRIVSFNGTNQAQEQDFTYTTTWGTGSSAGQWTQKTTTIQTKDLLRPGIPTSQTIYTYSPVRVSDLYSGMFIGQSAVENQIVYSDFNGATLRTVTKNWTPSSDPLLLSECTTLPNSGPTSGTFYTYGNLGVLTDKKQYDYGILASNACAQGSSPPTATSTRETAYAYQSFPYTPNYPNAASIFDRPNSIKVYDHGGSSPIAETDYAYDNYTGGIATVPSDTVRHDEPNFPPSYLNRGNVTSTTAKCFQTSCLDTTTTFTYDETGQVLGVTDPCGNPSCTDMTGTSHTTTYSYADSWLSGDTYTSGVTAAGTSNTFPTQITYPTTNGVSHMRSFSYDFPSGQLTLSKDENGNSTTYRYDDPIARLTSSSYPDNGQTTIAYNDAGPNPTITTSKLIQAGVNLTNVAVMDAIGHSTQSQLTSDTADGTDYTDLTYDGFGRIWTRSNPHRTGASSTDGSTTYYYDALGRTCLIVPPDGTQPAGSTCPTTRPSGDVFTTYSGNCATVTDEAGKTRQQCSDAFGRVTKVSEDPTGLNYQTNYSYDALNNLTCAVQKANDTTAFTNCASAPATWRPRSFVYDSLSHLISATNPESGTITYTYDANGNVATKIAPKPNQTGTATVVTTYIYDTLNRLTQKSYNDGSTPTVKYGYDGVALTGCTISQPVLADGNATGNRTDMCDGSGSTAWSHDTMGRVLTKKEKVDTFNQSTIYNYNLDGSVNTKTYPTAHVLSYGYNGAARPISLIDTTASINYVTACQTAPCYAPTGAVANVRLGVTGTFAGISLQSVYNSRLQPCWLYATTGSALPANTACTGTATTGTIQDVKYNFGLGTNDNGNVLQIANNRDNNRTQNFFYDNLNRIAQAYTNGNIPLSTSWGETFTIDAWGNLTNRAAVSGKTNTELLNAAPASTKNQLNGFCHDSAGNLGLNAPCPVPPNPYTPIYTYDAENRLITAGGYTYIYDGDGNRVKRTNGSIGTIYWRDASGEVIVDANLAGTSQNEYIFFGGKRIARRDVPTGHKHYYFSDHLGSASVITSDLGVIQEESDYFPYGGEIAITNGDPNTYKFTGKERDGESGLDMFGARYYGSSLGRFMTPDWSASPTAVPYADLNDPQTLNLYGYMRNNPLSKADPDGHGDCTVDGEKHGGTWCWLHQPHWWCGGPCVHTQREQADKDRAELNKQGAFFDRQGNRIDLSKMPDAQVIKLYGQYQNDEIPPLASTVFMTQWGWSGSKPYRDAVKQLEQPGTHENLGGKVPTQDEAVQMIRESGGEIERIEEGHGPESVSSHNEPHINYTTANGAKATVYIQAVTH